MKKILTVCIALCILFVLSACKSESTAIAGTYIPYQAYQIDETGRTLRCDGYESTAQSSETAKIVLNTGGTGYAVSTDGEINHDVSWEKGKVFLGSESLVYTLRGNKLTLKPADYQTMPVYMELILVKQ